MSLPFFAGDKPKALDVSLETRVVSVPTMMLRKCLFVILLTLVPLIKSEAGKFYESPMNVVSYYAHFVPK